MDYRTLRFLHQKCCPNKFLSFSVACNKILLWVTSFKVAGSRLKIFIWKCMVWVSLIYLFLFV